MDGALDTEQSAFSPIKQAVDANQSLWLHIFHIHLNKENVQSGIRFGGISYIHSLQFPFFQSTSNPFCHYMH